MPYLNAELHNLALLCRKAHLEGVLGVRQSCCAAAVYGAEELHIPGLLILARAPAVLHMRLQHDKHKSTDLRGHLMADNLLAASSFAKL